MIDSFGRRYLRFLRTGEILSTLLPGHRLRWFAFRLLGQWLSPYLMYRSRIEAGIQAGIGQNAAAAKASCRRWFASHGLLLEVFFRYRSLTTAFISGEVRIDSPAVFDEAVGGGGMILTYHCHHQNTLTALFGLAGATISPLAASEKSSPIYSAIGPYIHRANDDSALHFRGGRYILLDRTREALRVAHRALAKGELVLALCDYFSSEAASPKLHLFERCFSPPVGAMRLALRLDVPCYAAILYPEADAWRLRIQRLPSTQGLNTLAQAYLTTLEHWLRAEPAAWQGWDGYVDLPMDEP